MEAIMSPIFNHHALHGLPTNALQHLRETLRQSLGNVDLQENERANLHAALASVETVLRKRQAPPAPQPQAPSP
jgi:hypothetical protein